MGEHMTRAERFEAVRQAYLVAQEAEDGPEAGYAWSEELLRDLRERAMVDGEHAYLSTYCLHDDHAGCVAPGRAPQCKTCASPCLCSCHHRGEEG